MPIMNGMEATKNLRRMDIEGRIDLSRTQIYMHSAIQEVIEWDIIFDGKLSKPVSLDELLRVTSLFNFR